MKKKKRRKERERMIEGENYERERERIKENESEKISRGNEERHMFQVFINVYTIRHMSQFFCEFDIV